jgi:hypothetical protein
MRTPSDYSKEELLDYIADLSKLWLAHDGLWFLEVEREFDMDVAIKLDKNAWEVFTTLEAKKIMKRLGLESNCGIKGLAEAFAFRLYAHVNKQTVDVSADGKSCTIAMNDCRVQAARKRKGLPDFPCKPVGLVEYAGFASTIDSRIKTECIACPPDDHPEEYYCKWRFTLDD